MKNITNIKKAKQLKVMKLLSALCFVVLMTMCASNPVPHHNDRTTVIVQPVKYRPQPIRPQPYYAVQPVVYRPVPVPVRSHHNPALAYSAVTVVGK